MPRSSSSQRRATQGTPLSPPVRSRSGTQQVATRAPVSAVDLTASAPYTAYLSYAALNYQPLDATLTALAAVDGAADTVPYFTGVDTVALTPLTPYARTLLDDADSAHALETLDLEDLLYGLLSALAVFDALGLIAIPVLPLVTLEEEP